jgi:tetratricopeptide (TPR) repeat protein
MPTPAVNLAAFVPLPCLVFTLLFSAVALAQPDTEVTRMLFEPVLLVDGVPATDHVLVSFNAAQEEIPVPVSEQPLYSEDERNRMTDDIERYLSTIGDSEAAEGPYADPLREDLFNTALLYQKLEDHENAIKLFQRTLNVSRINNGLESLDQVEVLEALAQSFLAKPMP